MRPDRLWSSAETAAARVGGMPITTRLLPFSIPQRVWNLLPEKLATAEWRSLVMLNWAVEPGRLEPFLPSGTEIDLWAGKAWVSVVGLRFLNTKVGPFPIPFQQDYTQVNARFYVKHRTIRGLRHGVVFLKELVPRCLVSVATRLFVNENDFCRAMHHAIRRDGPLATFDYGWKSGEHWGNVHASSRGEFRPMEEGSHEEFIAHRLWTYSRQRDGKTTEMHVQHPRWRVCPVRDARLSVSDPGTFGAAFRDLPAASPSSAFVCEGSPVTMQKLRKW